MLFGTQSNRVDGLTYEKDSFACAPEANPTTFGPVTDEFVWCLGGAGQRIADGGVAVEAAPHHLVCGFGSPSRLRVFRRELSRPERYEECPASTREGRISVHRVAARRGA